ncbi:glutamine-dependent NAD(+) synthetase [Salix suchowensis]|nr:glutamine-dependent NAD(+) synthetase [Salix suchowensis]
MRLLKVATCNLNQWAMDFDCNLNNIKESITQAKQAGAVIRLGPELEITGYGCEDHFLELDTINHGWECLKEILVGDWTDGILCSIGMPVIKGSEPKIIMIRPKMWLANDGNYRELRWFTAWKHKDQLVDFQLPMPFGYGYLRFLDTAVAAEVCEELFTPIPPHAELALNGVEVFMNASGSHHQLRKLDVRLRAFIGATHTRGGVYMYSNQQGCDGGRLITFFVTDGCSCVVVNGEVVAQGSQFSLRILRLSLRKQASYKNTISSVLVPYKLCQPFNMQMSLSSPLSMIYDMQINYHSPEEEIAFGPGCWLWDYLRRSGASGFLLPLSGGADSSSVAAIVGCMCQLVVKEIENGDEQVKADAIRIGNYTDGQFPTDSKEFAKRIFYTVFMGSENSSKDTKKRAKDLADEIGSWHLDVSIDGVVSALLTLFQTLTGKRPRYKNLGLQNIQARIRMVLAFMLASLLPWVHNKPGFYLVLGSSNVDEGLRGYLTKYDCSSADINPIGSISKQDLRAFFDGLLYGRLRKIFRCGPVSMFKNLCYRWGSRSSPLEVADKVKHFFKYYSINRHKMTVMTPSYHAESYSPEDNRFDLRQFLYNARWPYQFSKIDELVKELDGEVAFGETSDQDRSRANGVGMGVVAAGSGDPKSGL